MYIVPVKNTWPLNMSSALEQLSCQIVSSHFNRTKVHVCVLMKICCKMAALTYFTLVLCFTLTCVLELWGESKGYQSRLCSIWHRGQNYPLLPLNHSWCFKRWDFKGFFFTTVPFYLSFHKNKINLDTAVLKSLSIYLSFIDGQRTVSNINAPAISSSFPF